MCTMLSFASVEIFGEIHCWGLDDVGRTPFPPSFVLVCCAPQFAAANSEELGVKCVPSLNLVYTEEEEYVTADVADAKNLVGFLAGSPVFFAFLFFWRVCVFVLGCV